MAKSKTATAARKRPVATGTVYQLKFTLKNTTPPIWRRVLAEDCTLLKLHDIIQESMGWTNSHLHVFDIDRQQYGDLAQWNGDPEVADSRRVKLSHLVQKGFKKILYIYDMGDGWDHVIQIEKELSKEAGQKYPHCIAGKRRCPPEDCGGPWGYSELVEAVSDPKDPENAQRLEWSGTFDPEHFDLIRTNAALRRV